MIEKTITVKGQGVTIDLLAWRHYRARARDMTPKILAANRGLAEIASPQGFLPVGTVVVLPALEEASRGTQAVTLW